MKTIELMINGQKAEFTTKSMTFDGKEYFYSNMTNLHHSPIILTYSFDYDDETKLLTYQKKDTKIMAAIFSQVHKLEEQRSAKAAAEAAKKAEAEKAAETEDKTIEAPAAETVEEAAEKKAEEPTETEPPEKTDVTKAEDTEKAAEEKPVDEKKDKKSIKEIFASLKPKKEASAEGENGEVKEKEPMDPEKQARLKKSLKIFAIVLAVIIAASIVYYFVFGTAKAPSDASPNNTESQQYDDIDQLIDDLQ